MPLYKWYASIKKAALALLFVFGMPSSSFSCSLIGLQHEVKFHFNESTLGKDEAVALAKWFMRQSDVRPYEEIDIVSMYPKGSKKLAEISKIRIQNISKIIDSMNTEGIFVVSTSVEGQQEGVGPVGYVYNEVLVVMSPSCTRTGTCCGISIR